jgi:hypothetical protein
MRECDCCEPVRKNVPREPEDIDYDVEYETQKAENRYEKSLSGNS